MALVTENNWPNVKLVAGTIVSLVVPLYVVLAPMLGLPMIDQQAMIENLNNIIAGVSTVAIAVFAIVGYFKRPAPGDGVKEKK